MFVTVLLLLLLLLVNSERTIQLYNDTRICVVEFFSKTSCGFIFLKYPFYFRQFSKNVWRGGLGSFADLIADLFSIISFR